MDQKRPERLTLGNIIRNFFQDLTSADRGLWGTIVQLTFRPRRVVDTFLFEDRSQFVRPTRYVLFIFSVAAIQFLILQYRYGEPLHEYVQPYIIETVEEVVESTRADFMADPDKASDPEFIKFVEETILPAQRENMISFQTNNIRYSSYTAIGLIPFVALFYWFIFPRRDFNYPETLASTGYIYSHSGLLTYLFTPLLVLSASPKVLFNGFILLSVVQSGYLLFATSAVFVRSWKDVLISLGIFLGMSLLFYLSFKELTYTSGYLLGWMNSGDGEMPNLAQFLPAFIAPILWFVAVFWLRLQPKRWLYAAGLIVLDLVLIAVF